MALSAESSEVLQEKLAKGARRILTKFWEKIELNLERNRVGIDALDHAPSKPQVEPLVRRRSKLTSLMDSSKLIC